MADDDGYKAFLSCASVLISIIIMMAAIGIGLGLAYRAFRWAAGL